MFQPLLLGAAVGGVAAALRLRRYYHGQLGVLTVGQARELSSLPVTPIAMARDGRVKIVGRVGTAHPVFSYYHRTPCAVLELWHYEWVRGLGPTQRVLSRREVQAAPFWIEDATGIAAIDPATACIDYEIEGGESHSTLEERRLRVGDNVAVVGIVRHGGPRLAHPMRTAADRVDQALHFEPGPLVTWRSDPGLHPSLVPPTAGIALGLASVGMAILGAVVEW